MPDIQIILLSIIAVANTLTVFYCIRTLRTIEKLNEQRKRDQRKD